MNPDDVDIVSRDELVARAVFYEAKGREEERNRIVAWLLKRSEMRAAWAETSAALWVAAKLIEANHPPETP